MTPCAGSSSPPTARLRSSPTSSRGWRAPAPCCCSDPGPPAIAGEPGRAPNDIDVLIIGDAADRDAVDDAAGLLPFGLTIEDLPRGVSKLRNRVVGRVFHGLGLIEQWGSGIQRMTAACREAGLPAPAFAEIAMRFRVTLSTVPLGEPVLDDTTA